MNPTYRNVGYFLIGVALFLGLIMIFVKLNFDEQAVYLCDAVHEDPELAMEDCPAHQSNVPWLLMVGSGLAFLVLGSGVYLIVTRKQNTGKEKDPPPRQQFADVDLSQLQEEEKQVYSLLKEKGGSAYQSDLVKELELSKVKITRMLDKLEHDDRLLERKRRGMANLVVLK